LVCSHFIFVFTYIGGQNVSVAAQMEKYFEKVLNLEQKAWPIPAQVLKSNAVNANNHGVRATRVTM